MSMKLISWNLNGIKSTEKEFLDLMDVKKPDIIMLQEVRSHPDTLSLFIKCIPGYKAIFNPSQRRGWSGTAIYYKDSIPLSRVSSEMGNSILDGEGRIIYLRVGNIFMFNFYTPNGGSSEERLKFKLKFYSEVLKYTRGLLSKGLSVILGGDLNVAHKSIDIYNPYKFQNISSFLPSERAWFSNLLDLGMVDSFRIFEKRGCHYTWWHMRDPKRKKNNGIRFDYFLVSTDLANRVKSAKILRDVFGSDHCPIELDLDINY